MNFRPRHYLTPEAKERIVKLFAAGVTKTQIAKRFDMTTEGVRYVLTHHIRKRA